MGMVLKVSDDLPVTDHLQTQIYDLQDTTERLEATVQEAMEKVGKNEAKLERLSNQITHIDGTMLRMRAEMPSKADIRTITDGVMKKDEFQEMLTAALNAQLAKGAKGFLVLFVAGVVTWVVNHITFK